MLCILLAALLFVSQAQAGSLTLLGAGKPPVVASGCTEATTFLARTSGLDGTHTTAYTNLICGLVTDGIWSKLDLLYTFATQDQATALLNLPNATYNAVNASSITFTADRGFTGDGTLSHYIATGFIPSFAPSPQFTLNSAHVSQWNLSNFAEGAATLYDSAGLALTNIYPKFSDNNLYLRVNDGSSGGFAISDPRGHLLGNRSSSTARQGYQNGSTTLSGGVTVSYGSVSSTGVPGNQLTALASAADSSIRQIAQMSVGSSLSSTDVTNFYNRLDRKSVV